MVSVNAPDRLSLALVLVIACGPSGATETPKASNTTRRAECTLARTGCHDVAECQGRGICEAASPSSDPGCGIPPTRVESCRVDSDCKTGEVCNSFSFGCEVGHRCEPRCDGAGCQDGWSCGADGRCGPRRCPADWDCADYGVCKPPAAGEGPLQGGRDWHGCVPVSCSSDADCPCAHCVNAACSPIPGRCIEARG